MIDDYGMTVLWGCAFEDFLSSGSGERNVAERVSQATGLEGERRGAGLHPGAADLRNELLYEVSDVVVGESFLARGHRARRRAGAGVRGAPPPELLLNGTGLPPGSSPFSAGSGYSGAVLPFSHPLAEEAVASIERVRKKARAEAGKLAKSLGRMSTRSALRP